ncbi:MAG: CBS domain-containing protein [Gemmatimonadetes bacterium]|nr:CBS domain-containing protein [Gemmatimonadota bacterium]
MKVVQKLQEEVIGHMDLDGYVLCEPQEPIVEVLKKMRHQHVSAVLVEEDGRLVGIFTERDALTKVVDQPATWTQSVAELMTRDPHSLDAQQPISSALRLMNAGDYRNVPIVDENGRIKGNLPQHEVIRFLTDQFPEDIYNLPPDPERIARTKEGA